jgi:hypothetical protein
MEKRKVYSMLAEQVVFSGTKDECSEYIENNSSDINQLYLVGNAAL